MYMYIKESTITHKIFYFSRCAKLNPRQINLFFDCVKSNPNFFWLILNYATTQKLKVL